MCIRFGEFFDSLVYTLDRKEKKKTCCEVINEKREKKGHHVSDTNESPVSVNVRDNNAIGDT